MTSPSLYKVIEKYDCNKHGECRARVVHVFSMIANLSTKEMGSESCFLVYKF